MPLIKMGIHQFLGQVKAGDGMEAIERESNRLGVKNVVRGARFGLKVASQLLPRLHVIHHTFFTTFFF